MSYCKLKKKIHNMTTKQDKKGTKRQMNKYIDKLKVDK